MQKKNLGLMLGTALGAMAALPMNADAQTLRVINYDASKGPAGAGGNAPVQLFIGVGNNVPYTAGGSRLRMYEFGSDGIKYGTNGFGSETNSAFTMPLGFGNQASNNTPNWLRFTFINNGAVSSSNSFPADMLITSMIVGPTYTQAVNVPLLAQQGTNAGYGDVYLDRIQTNIWSNPYATNYLKFTRKNSSSPKLENLALNGDGTMNLNVNYVLPGANITLQSRNNLFSGEWSSLATNYINVTPENFGGTTSTTFTNVDATAPQRFFRAVVQ